MSHIPEPVWGFCSIKAFCLDANLFINFCCLSLALRRLFNIALKIVFNCYIYWDKHLKNMVDSFPLAAKVIINRVNLTDIITAI